MHIAILTFDGFNELDSLIALGILNRVKRPGWRVSIASPAARVRSMNGVTLEAQASLRDAGEADAVIVGSGVRTREVVADAALMARLQLDPSRQLLGAQCSGTLVLAKLGLLDRAPACTDLTTKPWVQAAGVDVLNQPFFARRNVATAGGCLASPYLAAWVISRLVGVDEACSAISYVAPVGEKDDYVARAMRNIAPYLDEAAVARSQDFAVPVDIPESCLTPPEHRMQTDPKKYRLLTRSDMDGLVCAVLLKEMGMLGEIVFHHPKDVQDGRVAVTENDIITNLPYVPGCGLCFDHHASEAVRNGGMPTPNYILQPDAKSAARVVYDHYGGAARFPNVSIEMMEAVDKADSAGFSADDVLHPKGWELLSFLMDARTGLGRFRDFRVSNYQLMMLLIDCCRDMSIGDILALPDVKERVDLFFAQHDLFRAQIRRVARVHGKLVVLDLREEATIHAGNRFVVYAMYPQCDISMHVMWGREKLNTVYTVGKSIFDRGNKLDIGMLMLSHGGGGHHAAGTCQGDNESAEAMKAELIEQILAESPVEAFAG